VATQNKFDPPLKYYYCNTFNAIPIIECSFLKQRNGLKIRIIAGVECVAYLMKEVNDMIVS
jgi:hypothetical protein